MRTYGEVPVPKQVVVSTRCDNCGRVEQGDPEHWVRISWGHTDWGNDSIESGEHWDACSAPCLIALLGRVAAEYATEKAITPTLYVHLDELDYDMVKALAAAAFT